MIPGGFILENSRNVFYLRVSEALDIVYKNNLFTDYTSHISPKVIPDIFRDEYDIDSLKACLEKAKKNSPEAIEFQGRVPQKTSANRWTWWEIQFYNETYHLIGGDLIDVVSINNYRTVKIERTIEKIAWMQSHVVRAPVTQMLGLIAYLSKEKSADEETSKIYEMIEDAARKLDKAILEMTNLCNSIYN